MNKISSFDIRDKFLNFFEENNHLRIENASIIPKNDPTLLFINSGMAPIKKFFTGEQIPPSPDLCNIQPCIRTIDIDEVGDKHHLTSFQMLGSWSINNYFKKEAISLAFTFLTQYLQIPKDKLYVTVFAGDKELNLAPDNDSKSYWLEVGVDPEHIVFCPREDNFWGPTSNTGPCGPCTEVFYDTGSGDENKYIPGGHFDTKNRYIEIWNAGVFMQFNKNADGTFSNLKFTSVDTGAGLERLAMVLNGYSSVYDTDLLGPIRDFIKSELSGKGTLPERDILIMTDHLRTTSLILSEKLKPSNEGRGYIPRKLIRKCIQIVSKAKIKDFDFSNVFEFIIDNYSTLFPLFLENKMYIIDTVKKECTQFEKVLSDGLKRLESIKSSSDLITAEDAFELVTTYGLPIDIIKDFAKEKGLKLDIDGFNVKLEKHKNLSKSIEKKDSTISNLQFELFDNIDTTDFNGYTNFECTAKVLKIFSNNEFVDQGKENEELIIITDSSCFYAESGGQCCDIGCIKNNNFEMEITDVQKTPGGVILHFGKIISGTIKPGDTVNLIVNKDNRICTANNHSCVHLLQSALRAVLGPDLHQAGSKVEKDRLRFDFNYDEKLNQQDLSKVEGLVNEYIRMNLPLDIQIKDLSSAIKEGAIALFDNKYSDQVRVVKFGEISQELCGGTHTAYTGNIGLFIIISSEGIGKGIKRITAITGKSAFEYVQKQSLLIKDIASFLKVNSDDIMDKLKSNEKNKCSVKNNVDIDEKSLKIEKTAKGINYTVLTQDLYDKSINDKLISIADKINGIVLCIFGEEKKQIIVAVSEKLVEGYHAGNIVKNISAKLGGNGGGNKRVASGGGIISNSETIETAFVQIINS